MNENKANFIGVDLFAGAGGMSFGAQMAGIDVVLAVEKDQHAAATYIRNHPKTKLIVNNIKDVTLFIYDYQKSG